MEDKEQMASKSEPLVSFRDADILNGENVVIYGLDMEVFPGDFVYIVGKRFRRSVRSQTQWPEGQGDTLSQT